MKGAEHDDEGSMVPIRDLARQLRLHRVSIAEHCRTRGIPTYRRLPLGTDGGQLIAHVTEDDAQRIRAHYRDRLASRNKPTAAA